MRGGVPYNVVSRCTAIATALWLGSGLLKGEPLLKLDLTGTRAGFGASASSSDFVLVEGFVRWKSELGWSLGPHWQVRVGGELAAGWLGESAVNAAVFEVGPNLTLRRGTMPLAIEFGSNPTFLTRSSFATKDVGVPYQFDTYVGLRWNPLTHLDVAYRYQHLSNGGLGVPNPGLNMHVFALSYLF